MVGKPPYKNPLFDKLGFIIPYKILLKKITYKLKYFT
jgi:hypothetical protein